MTGLVVLDASGALEAVMGRTAALNVLDVVEAADEVMAPALFAAEVGNALWKHVRAGDFTRSEAHRALDSSLGLIDRMIPSEELVTEALSIACGFGHPVYDALYAVAAQRHGAAVCTMDRRLIELLQELRLPTTE